MKTGDTDKFYHESCETAFKLRCNNHNQSFKDNRKINSTELSKAVWKYNKNNQGNRRKYDGKPYTTQLHISVVQKHATYAYQKNYKYFRLIPKNY